MTKVLKQNELVTKLQLNYVNAKPRLPWVGADLQTVAHRAYFKSSPIIGNERIMAFPLEDGTNDIMSGTLNDAGFGGPLVVLLHGVAGHENSVYMWDTARHLVSLGYRVLRLNHRAAGASARTCSKTYQCLGTSDIRNVLALLPDDLTDEGIFIVGFSMGGVILINMLGEGDVDKRIFGALSVSAPLDLPSCSKKMAKFRNIIYNKALVRELMHMEKVLYAANGWNLTSMPNPKSLIDYDDLFTAKRHGYASAQDYYEKASPILRIFDVNVPLTLLHAENDPWIRVDDYHEVQKIASNNISVLLTKFGGHMGYHYKNRTEPFFMTVIEKLLQVHKV